MIIPGLSQIKTWALAGLGILASVMSVLFFRKKAQHESAKRKGIEKARETERKAADAMVEGITREQEKTDEAIDKVRSGDRTHFES